MKYTHQDALRAFHLVCQLLGKSQGYGLGEWYLDHAPGYGGYIVVEQVEGGGESRPLWDQRLSATRFCECVGFAMSVVDKLRDESESREPFLRRMRNRPTELP